jgi:hypothetical protein
VNEFLFKGSLAITKVMRDDLLIAFHLCLDLLRDCCLLQMILPDRQEGRTYHKTGGEAANKFIREFRAIPRSTDSIGILRTIEESIQCFDTRHRMVSQFSERRKTISESGRTSQRARCRSSIL